mmetsp:Transcript_37352/g.71597  ORF Transcript_37352/g.71597 Transcript_37352/m.71597 type:complete len:165 (-) Transcript_37352:442-936(-)|eukprot:CAMPEP_0114225322 /NCGR_PEP_ID=MMETSP0058-20121206/599_1 /TAXON_ID=36894 /ORGANISM="Pyramimonas parkeae, CCMP726" /LENGTH=164 /DNA_ID=CAMNT_0001335897 /DNA_START=116 /DNA_END=610 /DNA_ORIENTATION=+
MEAAEASEGRQQAPPVLNQTLSEEILFMGALQGKRTYGAHISRGMLLPRLPGTNPKQNREVLFKQALNSVPKDGGQILRGVCGRRRALTPKFSISKQQVREVGKAAESLDEWGYHRSDVPNPLVPELPTFRKPPRDEPHYWQDRPRLYPVTSVISTSLFSTTRF